MAGRLVAMGTPPPLVHICAPAAAAEPVSNRICAVLMGSEAAGQASLDRRRLVQQRRSWRSWRRRHRAAAPTTSAPEHLLSQLLVLDRGNGCFLAPGPLGMMRVAAADWKQAATDDPYGSCPPARCPQPPRPTPACCPTRLPCNGNQSGRLGSQAMNSNRVVSLLDSPKET